MFAVPLYSTCSQPPETFSTTLFSSSAPGNLSSQQNTIQTVLDNENIQFQLYGNQFRFRSAERAGRKFKHKETIELWKWWRTRFTNLSTGRATYHDDNSWHVLALGNSPPNATESKEPRSKISSVPDSCCSFRTGLHWWRNFFAEAQNSSILISAASYT